MLFPPLSSSHDGCEFHNNRTVTVPASFLNSKCDFNIKGHETINNWKLMECVILLLLIVSIKETKVNVNANSYRRCKKASVWFFVTQWPISSSVWSLLFSETGNDGEQQNESELCLNSYCVIETCLASVFCREQYDETITISKNFFKCALTSAFVVLFITLLLDLNGRSDSTSSTVQDANSRENIDEIHFDEKMQRDSIKWRNAEWV